MSREDSITRTTCYLPSYLHTKAQEAGLNLSKELKLYLETVLFGDQVSDIQHQLDQLDNRIRSIKIELTSLNARRKELLKIVNEHDAKLSAEKNLCSRFLMHCKGHIKNAKTGKLSLDLSKLKRYWRQDYFPGNGLSEKDVDFVLNLVDKDKFTFDQFKVLRRGDTLAKN